MFDPSEYELEGVSDSGSLGNVQTNAALPRGDFSDAESDGFGQGSVKKYRSSTPNSIQFPPPPPQVTLKPHVTDADQNLSDCWESFLESSLTFSVPARTVKLPWEIGFANQVFGGSSSSTTPVRLPPIPLISDPIPVNIQATARHRLAGIDRPGAWPIVSSRIVGIKWNDCKDIKRSRALTRLQNFFLESPESTGLGRTLMSDILSLQSEDRITAVVADVFSNKSTRTLDKRAASLTLFSLFCRLHSQCPLPISESLVYQYLQDKCGTSASKAQQFREALNFCIDTLQIDGAFEATSSPRVKGFCFRAALQKNPLKQADVLKVLMVTALERIVMAVSEFEPDRIFAGHCCFCLHGRLRWSDSQSILSCVLDIAPDGSGFGQADSLDSKTSTTADKKRTFLPLTALLKGISTDQWCQTWIQLREDAGLKFGEGCIPMQSVTASGTFSGFPLEPGDASKWLRELLIRAGFTTSQVRGVSSHSLKSTALSWAAKYGMPRELRQVLGYHVVSGSAASLHYSRDEQAYPLRRLQEVYDEIGTGEFNPDATRSGYRLRIKKPVVWPELEPQESFSEVFMSPKPKVRAGVSRISPVKETPETVVEDDSADVLFVSEHERQVSEVENESSTSDSQSSESGDAADEELADIRAEHVPLALEVVAARRAPAKAGERLFFHTLWCTIHKEHASDPSRLACGRPVHAGFKILSSEGNLVRPKCGICFGKNAQVQN
jgi:hypothetical protein